MTFKDLHMGLSEQDYHDYPALSYSLLSRYDRDGYAALSAEEETTPSLSLGSMVDCLLTRGEEEFDSRYAVIDTGAVSPAVANVISVLATSCPQTQMALVSDDAVLQACDVLAYQTRWKDSTRIDKIREEGSVYYNALKKAGEKTIVSPADVERARRCVEALLSDACTYPYFRDPLMTEYERIWQLQLCMDSSLEVSDMPIMVKGMIDLLLIDKEKKFIIPCDIKTTSDIYHFEDSFYKYRYYLQADIYTWLLVKAIYKCSPEYSGYTLRPYRFIVIDTNRFVPMVFEWNEHYHEVLDKTGLPRNDWRKLAMEVDWAQRHPDEKIPMDWAVKKELDGMVSITNYYDVFPYKRATDDDHNLLLEATNTLFNKVDAIERSLNNLRSI